MAFDAALLIRRLQDGTFRGLPEWHRAVRDLSAIDRIRELAIPELCQEPARWVKIVLDLLEGTDRDELYLALILERPLVRKGCCETLNRVKVLYDGLGDDPYFRFHMAHELFEDDAWYVAHRSEYATWVRAHRDLVTPIVLDLFQGSEASLCEGMFVRLEDVLGESRGSKTQNSPNKAFTYALYCELLAEPALRGIAAARLVAFRGRGDEFFKDVLERAVKALLGA